MVSSLRPRTAFCHTEVVPRRRRRNPRAVSARPRAMAPAAAGPVESVPVAGRRPLGGAAGAGAAAGATAEAWKLNVLVPSICNGTNSASAWALVIGTAAGTGETWTKPATSSSRLSAVGLPMALTGMAMSYVVPVAEALTLPADAADAVVAAGDLVPVTAVPPVGGAG